MTAREFKAFLDAIRAVGYVGTIDYVDTGGSMYCAEIPYGIRAGASRPYILVSARGDRGGWIVGNFDSDGFLIGQIEYMSMRRAARAVVEMAR